MGDTDLSFPLALSGAFVVIVGKEVGNLVTKSAGTKVTLPSGENVSLGSKVWSDAGYLVASLATAFPSALPPPW